MLCKFMLFLGIFNLFSAKLCAERWIVDWSGRNQNGFGFVDSMAWDALSPHVIKTISFDHTRLFVIDVDAQGRGDEVEALFQELRAESGVQGVYPDFPIGLVMPMEWDWQQEQARGAIKCDDGWHIDRLQLPKFQNQATGGGIAVAVLDMGNTIAHPHLRLNLWNNSSEFENSLDDDGNGYIDDIHGWNFHQRGKEIWDCCNHGTHTSGIVAADPLTNEDHSPQGVAPDAKVMTVKILGGKTSPNFMSNVIEGIYYAVKNGAKVLSNSWRIYQSWEKFKPTEENLKLLRQAIEYAGSKGAVFVVAAGNEDYNLDTHTDTIYPAGFAGLSNMVVVGASDRGGSKAYFSNFGETVVDVLAPGTDICSTARGGDWINLSGTSMATPIVSGLIARGLGQGLSSLQVIDALRQSSIKSSNGWSKYGIVDGERFMQTILGK